MRRLILASVLLCLLPGLAVAAACQSNGSGTWSTVGIWINCNGQAPGTGDADSVEVRNGHTVTLNANITNLTGITVRNGGILQFGNDNTARTLTVGGGVTVDAGGIFRINAASNTLTHALSLSGSIANAGTFDMQTDAGSGGNVTFTGTAQAVSGAGATTRFRGITVNMTGATVNNIVEVTATNFSMGQAITFTDGTFRLSAPVTLTPTAAWTIPANARFSLNHAGATVTQNANITLNGGELQVSLGTLNVGNATNELIALNNLASTRLEINGGTVNVAGRVASAATGAAGTFAMANGTLTVGTVGNTTNNAIAAPFFLGTATTFNMSGGTIAIQRHNNAANADEFDVRSTTSTVTGGTVQLGDGSTPAAQSFEVLSTPALWNLTLNSTGSPTAQVRAALTVRNVLTIGNGTTLNANSFAITLGGAAGANGDWINNGTFTPGTQTVSFTGDAATQSLGGSAATTFSSLTVNKAGGVLQIACATPSPVVNATLTFTNGKIVTSGTSPGCAATCGSQVPLILGTAGTIGGTPGATSYLQGALRKNYSAAAALSFVGGAGDDFPVGDATNYTPVEIFSGTTSAAGNLTVCTIPSQHPQITLPPQPTGILDSSKALQRYWSLTNGGLNVAAAPMEASFIFVASDVPGIANPANFRAQDWDGTKWDPTTFVSATATSTRVSNIVLSAAINEVGIGELIVGINATLGRFNAFETSTPANALLGRIQTKPVSTNFSLDIVSINTARNAYGGAVATVTVQILDSTNNAGAIDANGCNANWTIVQTLPGTFNIPAAGRLTINNVNASHIRTDARIRLTGGGNIGCSSDRFAIRPQSVTVSAHDTNWTTAGTTRNLDNGGPVHKAGTAVSQRPFTLRATPAPVGVPTDNYGGILVATTGYPACIGGGCVNGTLALGTWGGTGVRESSTANYAEAGAFNLRLQDESYADVDLTDGSPGTCSNVAPFGRYVCSSADAAIGAFVPDRFEFAAAAVPQLQTFGSSCATRSFTYVGQPFWFATRPSATLNAVNAAGTVTANYAVTASVPAIAETYSDATAPIAAALDAGAAGTPSLTAGSGTGTYEASTTGSLRYTRGATAAVSPFNAAITLSVAASDTAYNAANQGTISTPVPLLFNGSGSGIAFDAGAQLRYGQARLLNASGPLNVDLPVTLRTEYYNGAGFVTNSADQCSSFAAGNFQLSGHVPGLTPANMGAGNVSISGSVSSGVANLRLTKPSPVPAQPGRVRLCLDLGADVPVACAATSAAQPWLQGRWSGANYDDDPSATAAFGLYGLPRSFIFQRENY